MSEPSERGEERQGPVIEAPPGKTRITIRIDDDVLKWFRAQADAAGGANYQTLMNQALRDYLDARREPLEDTVRRVVREELAAYASGEDRLRDAAP